MSDGDPQPLPGAVRRRRMAALIEERGFLRVTDLARAFDISEVTVRSDLDRLADAGAIERVHGGALAASGNPLRELPIEEATREQAGVKTAIGRAAAGLVSSGDSIIVDVGSTAVAVARALTEREDLEDVVVFTYGISTALALERRIPDFTVILTGGALRPRQHSLVQPMSGEWLERLSVTTAFVGCTGIHADAGVTHVNVAEANVKEHLVAAGKRVVVTADGSKVGKTSLVRFADVADVDVLITTPDAPAELLAPISDRGVRPILADWEGLTDVG